MSDWRYAVVSNEKLEEVFHPTALGYTVQAEISWKEVDKMSKGQSKNVTIPRWLWDALVKDAKELRRLRPPLWEWDKEGEMQC